MNQMLKLLVWIDRAANRLTGGTFYETLSSRAYRMDIRDQPVWGWTAAFINMLFFGSQTTVASSGNMNSGIHLKINKYLYNLLKD